MPFIELSRVSFFYLRKTKSALSEINLVFEKDQITAVVGPNGSGKTTLTKLMTGVLKPEEGEIRIAGRPIGEYSLSEIGGRVGYVFQNPDMQLFCNTVEEEIGFGLKNRGGEPEFVKRKVGFYLDYFELTAYRNTFPLHLSQGEKQRLAIAAVLANEPEFLILDEPTAGLDACRKKNLEDCLKKAAQLGRGMIVVSHDEDFIGRMAQRTVVMENGHILYDIRWKGNTGHED
ncbi:ABC transporter ATP-binding protein [Petroclostridium sp. X23]|uniref:energy-coupling factor ABC transporter ATP-binding protein n=1 Tax=Petroclostridium sp. X23 TaxID=3045146 RepID=UPI0024AE2DB1|nr:ABC transporter ATP-binding protein [Petroclostridium sp. X23]WHH57773.1 ABC transporter ATP-binding protein [Petroclostridium sp. X23]